REEVDNFGETVARDMPGGDGYAEAELLAQRLLNRKSVFAQRSERARRAGKLPDKDAWFELRKTFRMAVEHRKPDRGLVAEGHRQRLLQMGAAGHGCVTVAPREIGEDGAQRADVPRDDLKALPHLQHHGRIHDV